MHASYCAHMLDHTAIPCRMIYNAKYLQQSISKTTLLNPVLFPSVPPHQQLVNTLEQHVNA